MTYYEIWNRVSGHSMGFFEANSLYEALCMLAAEADEDVQRLIDNDEIVVEEIDTDDVERAAITREAARMYTMTTLPSGQIIGTRK